MFKKSPLKATRLRKRKQKILAVKVGACVFALLILFFSIVWLSHSKFMEIDSISVTGNSGVDTQNISGLAAQTLVGPYWGLFSKYNRFLYPKQKIILDLLKTYPRLQTVSMNVHGHDLAIRVTERTPAYTWCTGTPDTSTSKDCYFMDENGYIFSAAPIFSGHAYFAFYGLVGATPIGAHYLDSKKLSDVETLRTAEPISHTVPYAFLAEDNGVYDLMVGHGTKIIYNDSENIADVISNLKTIASKVQLFTTTPATLLYVDMRFGNKIYYRYSGDNSATSTP